MKCRGTGGDCEREAVCKAEGLCNYTGSPLIDTDGSTRCFVQDGCDNRTKCKLDGECHYAKRTDRIALRPSIREGFVVSGCCGTPLNCTAIEPCDLISNAVSAEPTVIDPRTQAANPKQAYGDKKIPLYLLPFSFAANVCVALYEGMTKYGLVNWRVTKVEAMTYASACKRHVDKWINGEECDPTTKVRHLANAGACIAILIDAEVCGTLIDNRPYPIPQGSLDKMIEELEATLAHLKVLHSDRNPKHYYITDAVEEL